VRLDLSPKDHDRHHQTTDIGETMHCSPIFAAVLVSQPTAIPRVEAGQEIVLNAPFLGWVPALAKEPEYLRFLDASKTLSNSKIMALRPDGLRFLPDGPRAKVLEIRYPTDKRAPAFRRAVANVPAMIVQFVGERYQKVAPFWVPSVYTKGRKGEVHPALPKFPVIWIYPDQSRKEAPGENRIVVDGDQVALAANGPLEYGAMVKAQRAGDEIGIQGLVRARKVIRLEGLT
jgi:hypothetical protein